MPIVTEPSPLSYAAIASYADVVGEHHEVWDEQGHARVDELITTLGGVSKLADSEESLHVVKPGEFTIFIPRLTSERRDRFTKAHELGHYFVHYVYPELTGEKVFGRGGSDPAETQANVFAAALLMPARFFSSAWSDLHGDTWKVARRFDVSPRAAEVRAEVLRLT